MGNKLKANEVKYYPPFEPIDNMAFFNIEGEPVTVFELILEAIYLLLLPGLVILFVIWCFFQAADPENKRIQTGKAPTVIEFAWAIPWILISISSGGFLLVPGLFAMIFLRMYLVKIYQLFNPDWRTDGTSVGIPSVERLGEALNDLPNKDEIIENIAEDIADHLIHEYQDDDSLLRRLFRAWPIGPVIEFHKKNHKKKWFIIYVYFVVVPFLIVLLILSLIVPALIEIAIQIFL